MRRYLFVPPRPSRKILPLRIVSQRSQCLPPPRAAPCCQYRDRDCYRRHQHAPAPFTTRAVAVTSAATRSVATGSPSPYGRPSCPPLPRPPRWPRPNEARPGTKSPPAAPRRTSRVPSRGQSGAAAVPRRARQRLRTTTPPATTRELPATKTTGQPIRR